MFLLFHDSICAHLTFSPSTNNFAHAQTLSRMSSLSGRMKIAPVNIEFFTRCKKIKQRRISFALGYLRMILGKISTAISIKHRILATFSINKKINFDSLYAFKNLLHFDILLNKAFMFCNLQYFMWNIPYAFLLLHLTKLCCCTRIHKGRRCSIDSLRWYWFHIWQDCNRTIKWSQWFRSRIIKLWLQWSSRFPNYILSFLFKYQTVANIRCFKLIKCSEQKNKKPGLKNML